MKTDAIEKALEAFAWWVDISGAPEWAVKKQADKINAARKELRQIKQATTPSKDSVREGR